MTEYVPGRFHSGFLDALRAIGLEHSLTSPKAPGCPGENHVLIVSRWAMIEGNIRAPPIAPSVPSNVIHAMIPELSVDVLGLRVPDYSRAPATRRAVWEWLLSVAGTLLDRSAVMLGDFNTDPKYPRARCGDRLARLVDMGWVGASPQHGESYRSPSGAHAVRIDHAFATRDWRVKTSCYLWSHGAVRLAGERGAISDHAALLVEAARDVSSVSRRRSY